MATKAKTTRKHNPTKAVIDKAKAEIIDAINSGVGSRKSVLKFVLANEPPGVSHIAARALADQWGLILPD